MNKYKIASVLVLLFILFSCDPYDLVRTNTYDPKSDNYKPIPPTLTTTAATAITSNSATLGGNVTADGGAAVTARGVCWNTATNPTTANSKTSNGTGKGTFTSNLTGLTGGTKYYVRAYATNIAGTAYGSVQSFTTAQETVTDVDGNVYHSVIIGTQQWTVENLKTTKYNDNSSIPLVTDGTAWASLSTPGYSWYNNDATTYKAVYGALYNWYAVNTGKLCPTGWHIPTDAEWTTLSTYLGGESVAGGKLKETGTTHWLSPNTGATNETGFTAVPGGERFSNGTFDGIRNRSVWWSATELDATNAWYRHLGYDGSSMYRGNNVDKKNGFAVRCIKGSQAVVTIPTISTQNVTNITSATATSGGNVTSDGGASVTARGVCWSTTANPTIALTTKTSDGTGSGSFTSSITGLVASTTYHVRAYATNSAGTAYGTDILFSTTGVLPTITTTAVTAITGSTATSGGNITSDGGNSVSARGVCWSTTADPTIALTTKTSDGTGIGSFTSNITGLTGGTTYHVRAYATTSAGTAYGTDISFTSSASAATITTTAATAITGTTATSGGNITSDGGATVNVRGVCWSTATNPTIADSKTFDGTGIGIFTSNITGLSLSTKYYVRAYASNSAGTAYGAEISFTTTATPGVPTVSTTALSAITSTSATSGGNITSDGGAAVSARGVCWSTTADPTIALTTKTSDGTGSGSFTSNITGLTGGTTYHVRAYATNSAGTAYGTDISFATSGDIPTITTTAITANVGKTAISGGNITSDGGASVTARGVCWGPALNPAVSGRKTNDGTGSGSFVSNLTGLSIDSTYHVRAYATNSSGTAYGQDIVFTTPNIPTVTTTAITSITQTSASTGGNITSDGGVSVTERGVCWSTTTNPTIALTTKTTNGTGSGVFISSITDLNVSTTYYVRAYATNSAGTAYGANVSFSTSAADIPTITTTPVTANVGITATSGGNITSDGAAAVTARGVCWGSTLNPTIADSKTNDGPGSGSFTSNLTGLTIGTSYHIRAYATNSVGTAYGQDIAFTTPNIPTISTTAITSITQTSASTGGNITSDGGASVTGRGVCWSTTTNPTIALTTKTTDGSGSGSFTSSVTGLSVSTTYYVRAYATNSAGTAYGDNVSFITSGPVVPTLSTSDVSAVTLTTATSGGNVTDDGYAAITARGVCWSTTTGPTVSLSTKTTDGSGTGTFTSSITSLLANSVYYLRAYATNSAGTGYGNEIIVKTSHSTLTDTTNNTYYTIEIGTQIWMRENLKTTKYRDGNNIANVTDNAAWSALTTGAYSWYNNDVANKDTYGALYNWYTITDSRVLCPRGWHVPTDAEWTTLTTYLAGTTVAGGKLKETGTTHWLSPNTGATNETGFTALPGGFRYGTGMFTSINSWGYWWSATENGTTDGYYLRIYHYSASSYRSSINKAYGHSVRCLKN